ncbi:HAD family hydrolase [Deinococcus peraridilitoris]|uniref:HAD family hydrolase n=1 Tax=Deinococcus peraridilitoris TaxID=432329 RepID=UPI000694D151
MKSGLNELRGAAFALAVATNKVQTVALAMLETAGIAHFFPVVVGSDMVPLPKPHPALGFLTAECLHAQPVNCVMIGDTPHDVQMARAAGRRSVALTHGTHDHERLQPVEPTIVLQSYGETVKWLIAQGRQGPRGETCARSLPSLSIRQRTR